MPIFEVDLTNNNPDDLVLTVRDLRGLDLSPTEWRINIGTKKVPGQWYEPDEVRPAPDNFVTELHLLIGGSGVILPPGLYYVRVEASDYGRIHTVLVPSPFRVK